MHRVVAGAEEDPPPQVRHPVAVALLDPDQAAALGDVGQLLVAHGVLHPAGQLRQHGEGEQRLQGAGRRQRLVRLARGQHLPAARVGDQPGQRGDVRQLGGVPARAYLRARAVEQGRGRGGRPGRGRRGLAVAGQRGAPVPRGGRGGTGQGRGERQQARHTQGTGGYDRPISESGDHMINVRTGVVCARRPRRPAQRSNPDASGATRLPYPVSSRAASAEPAAGRPRCRGCAASAPAASPGPQGSPRASAGRGAARGRRPTRPG